MRPTTDLIEIDGTFSNWVNKNTDWIKQQSKNRPALIERLTKLREENVNISENKIKVLIERVQRAKSEFQLMSVFYHAAISHIALDEKPR